MWIILRISYNTGKVRIIQYKYFWLPIYSKSLIVYGKAGELYNLEMKLFIMSFILMVSAFADQGKLLSIARDSYLKSALREMKVYCDIHRSDLAPDENHFYICSLQVKADCSHGEDEIKASACPLKERIEKLENMVLVSDRNLSVVERIPVGKSLSAPLRSKVKLIPPSNNVKVTPDIPSINRMSDEEWIDRGRPNKEEFHKAGEEWIRATNQLNATSVKKSCHESSECQLIYYGSSGCSKGGRDGFIVANTGPQSEAFTTALANYNSVEANARKIIQDRRGCLAWVVDYKAICRENICQSLRFNP